MSQNRQDIREFFKRKRSESPIERSPCVKKSAQDFSKSATSGLNNKETAPAENNGNVIDPSGFDGLIENSLKNGALVDRTNNLTKSSEIPQFSSESSEDTDNEKKNSSDSNSAKKLPLKHKIKKSSVYKECTTISDPNSDVEVSFNNCSKKRKEAKDHDEMGPREFSDEDESSNSSHDNKMGPKEFSAEESDDNDTALDQPNADKEAVESVNNKSTTSSKGETEEYEVEAVLDYQWCKATVSFLTIMHSALNLEKRGNFKST